MDYPHLDPVSWRFYLPAFMRFGLRALQQSSGSIDLAIYALALYDDRELNDHMRRRFESLDPAQVRVVHRFLELASENGDHCDDCVARRALDPYWSKAIDAL